jgi:hypothetical protein
VEGRAKDWNTESAVHDWKADCCLVGEGDVNDGKAECCIEGEGDVNEGIMQFR